MRRSNRDVAQKSALCLPDQKEKARLTAYDWERDAQLLNSLAYLSGSKLYSLLRRVSWSVGEATDAKLFYKGHPLSAATRARLQDMLRERVRVEQEVLDNCRQASAQIMEFVALFVGLAAAMLFLLR